MNTPDTPRIYVACLAAYNNGRLHGAWIDATQDVEQIEQEVQSMLAASPIPDAEEYAIHDYEGFGTGVIEEYTSFEHVHELACFIDENPAVGLALLRHFCGDLGEAKRALENYTGCYASLADYAQELTEETIEIHANITFYIEYEKMARDMEMGGDVFTIETGFEEVHVFWNH